MLRVYSMPDRQGIRVRRGWPWRRDRACAAVNVDGEAVVGTIVESTGCLLHHLDLEALGRPLASRPRRRFPPANEHRYFVAGSVLIYVHPCFVLWICHGGREWNMTENLWAMTLVRIMYARETFFTRVRTGDYMGLCVETGNCAGSDAFFWSRNNCKWSDRASPMDDARRIGRQESCRAGSTNSDGLLFPEKRRCGFTAPHPPPAAQKSRMI